MAFKKTQSTSFNPASIQVNRGQGARQLGASIGELGTANSRGVNNFINKFMVHFTTCLGCIFKTVW